MSIFEKDIYLTIRLWCMSMSLSLCMLVKKQTCRGGRETQDLRRESPFKAREESRWEPVTKTNKQEVTSRTARGGTTCFVCSSVLSSGLDDGKESAVTLHVSCPTVSLFFCWLQLADLVISLSHTPPQCTLCRWLVSITLFWFRRVPRVYRFRMHAQERECVRICVTTHCDKDRKSLGYRTF